MSVENIQLNLKQKINTKDIAIRVCSLLPDGRMVFSSSSINTVLSLTAMGIVVMTLLLSISIIAMQLLTPYPDDTAMVLLSLI
jgi:hypothetical protein